MLAIPQGQTGTFRECLRGATCWAWMPLQSSVGGWNGGKLLPRSALGDDGYAAAAVGCCSCVTIIFFMMSTMSGWWITPKRPEQLQPQLAWSLMGCPAEWSTDSLTGDIPPPSGTACPTQVWIGACFPGAPGLLPDFVPGFHKPFWPKMERGNTSSEFQHLIVSRERMEPPPNRLHVRRERCWWFVPWHAVIATCQL